MDKPKYWVKNAIRKNVQLKVGLKLEITFLTQHLALSISYPHLGSTTQHHLECRSFWIGKV